MAIQLNNGVTNEYAYHDGSSIKAGTAAHSFCCWVYRDTDQGANEWIGGLVGDRTAETAGHTTFYVDASGRFCYVPQFGGLLVQPVCNQNCYWMKTH